MLKNLTYYSFSGNDPLLRYVDFADGMPCASGKRTAGQAPPLRTPSPCDFIEWIFIVIFAFMNADVQSIYVTGMF